MNVYFFSSTSTEHVRIAIERRQWAIRPHSDRFQANLASKAVRLKKGDRGLFYIKARREFAVPFIIQSTPRDELIENAWNGTWHFPFEIDPLGVVLERNIPWARAKDQWIGLRGDPNPQHYISARFTFLPFPMEDFEWKEVMEELG